jgi:hypothetical protein
MPPNVWPGRRPRDTSAYSREIAAEHRQAPGRLSKEQRWLAKVATECRFWVYPSRPADEASMRDAD